MSKKKDDRLRDEMWKRFEGELEVAKQQVATEERCFHIETGARLAIASLYAANAIHPDCKSFVADWMHTEGPAGLAIHGLRICPPTLP